MMHKRDGFMKKAGDLLLATGLTGIGPAIIVATGAAASVIVSCFMGFLL